MFITKNFFRKFVGATAVAIVLVSAVGALAQDRYTRIGAASIQVANSELGVQIIGFYGREREVNIPPSHRDAPITIIASYAFDGKGLISVTIPEGITHIGNSAFRRNNLAEITIPNSVRRVANNAFQNNQLSRVTIGANVELYSNSIARGFTKVYNDGGKQAGTYVLNGRVWTREE